MGRIRSLIIFGEAFLFNLALPVRVFAAEPTPPEDIKLCPEDGSFAATLCLIRIEKVISTALILLIIVAALIAFFFLIIGGIKWITAGSNKEAASEARGTLTAAIVGLVIVFVAWALIVVVGQIFNLDLLNLKIPQIGK